MIPRIARTLALAIPAVAAIDPAITVTRPSRPVIAILAGRAPDDSALATRLARELAHDATPVLAPLPGADATVVVGAHVPAHAADIASPAYAIVPDLARPAATLDAVSAPPRAALDSRVPVAISARVLGARGRTMAFTLRVAGVVVDRVERAVASDDDRARADLAFVPTATGAARVEVSAGLVGGASPVTTGLVIDVRDARTAVLFYDPRPSWMSTFVRRAIERDPRFVVTSRIVTSRNISTDAGQPPANLDDRAALAPYAVVVVGAPEALSDHDVTGLEAFMRRRGGSVVFAMDQHSPGPYERLLAASSWGGASGRPLAVTPVQPDGGALRASELAWPTDLPPGADVVATSAPTAETIAHPAVWRSAVGAGQLLVSAAFDAWQFRDEPGSPFDVFWQRAIADAAAHVAPALDLRLTQAQLAPGETTELHVVVREASLGVADGTPVRTEVSAAAGASGKESVLLWPEGAVGCFRGTIHAPSKPGLYAVSVTANGVRETVPYAVARGAAHAEGDDRDLVAGWTVARGGRVYDVAHLTELRDAVLRSARGSPERVPWHPMRSGWWIAPFALALGVEWYTRRRRGLP